MRILITGGNGCLGSNLVDYYSSKVEEIFVIDNYETSNKDENKFKDNVTVQEGSITDRKLIKKIFENFKPTHVIHCAASYKDPFDYQKDIDTNITGTINLIDASEAYNIKKFINFQTSLCYGKPYKIPIPIDHYLNPKSSYAISKTAGELYLSNSKLNFISYRLASVLAPRLFVGAIPTFYKRLLSNKDCFCSDTVRDYIGFEDFLKLVDITLEDNSPKGIFNASSGKGVSTINLHSSIAKILKIKNFNEPPIVPPGEDDIAEVVMDPSQTLKELGWETTIDFKESLKNLINWYNNNKFNEVYSHVLKPDIFVEKQK